MANGDKELTVSYLVDGNEIKLTPSIVQNYLVGNDAKITLPEFKMFTELCKVRKLNPFLKEAYLVKYGDEVATIITGKDTFTKRADRLPQYDGFKAGIIVTDNTNQATYREGSFSVAGEKLLGGWAEVFRKDRAQSFRNEVSLSEYERRKKDGSLMSNWRTMPATMIRKVALVQSLREAFPDEFGGMYSPEEMPVDASTLPVYEAGRPPVIINPESKPEPEKAPIQKPQKKAETKAATKEAEQVATVQIVSVTHKDGKKKDGTDYKIFTIFDEADVKYGTFSDTFADLANSAKEKKLPVKITFTDGQYGRKVTNLEIVEKEAA